MSFDRLWLLCLCLLCACAASVETGLKSIERGDYVYSPSVLAPQDGWQQADLPFHDFFEPATAKNAARRTLWIRLDLMIDEDAPAAQAVMIDYTSERYTAFLNGERIARNYADAADHSFASFAPAEIALPADQLRAGRNELLLRLETDTPITLGIGRVKLGSASDIRHAFDIAYFWQFVGPQIVNGIIAVLTIFVLGFWFWRREEHSFFWLATLGVIWWVRNLHYSSVDPSIGPVLMWEAAICSLCLIMFAFFAFVATFFNVPRQDFWIKVSAACAVFLLVLRWVLVASGQSDFFVFLILVTFAVVLLVTFVQAIWRQRTLENLFMLIGVLVALGFSFHDFGFLGKAWRGAGFQLQPYASLIVYPAFFFAIGRRVLRAFSMVENMNAMLETQVRDATQKLIRSETEKRELEVRMAIERERERIMQDMHDRIGSSLISAISSASSKDGPAEAVRALKAALLELRITIDSLEPFEGDTGLLLAGFRHRIERELHQAGAVFEWDVAQVPPLEWMDATSGLHLLRMLQETFANILAHSGATRVRVACRPEALEGRQGIAISISDNGCGFDSRAAMSGKGLKILAARMESLQGRLTVDSQTGEGTQIQFWLPQHK
jgi:signal transduction histidine kinase